MMKLVSQIDATYQITVAEQDASIMKNSVHWSSVLFLERFSKGSDKKILELGNWSDMRPSTIILLKTYRRATIQPTSNNRG